MMSNYMCTHDTFYKLTSCNKQPIFLGARADLDDYIVQGGRPWLVVDLTGMLNYSPETKLTLSYNPSTDVKGISLFQQLLDLAKLNYAKMTIDWEDRGIPSYDRSFWDVFVKTLRVAEGPVFIHCVGGHGRTGTIAAILVGLLEIKTSKRDPITYVREEYCQSAVESDVQIWYVETITGIDCDEARSKYTPAPATPNQYVDQRTANIGYGRVISPGYTPYHDDPPAKENKKSTPSNHGAVMEVTKDMYDDLNWDTLHGYLDSEGNPIGKDLPTAITELRRRKALKGNV